MTTGKALNGKPYAGNPHVRFDEGAGAPRHSGRSALLYSVEKAVVLLLAVVCLGECGKAEMSSTSIGESEASREKDARAKLQSVTNDYVHEVVEEAKGVRVIYTDGVFDDDIRRVAKRRGIELEPISIMERGVDSLRVAITNGEDVALQFGFDLWKRAGTGLPLCGGVLARTGKMLEEDRQRGIETARRLGERILELHKEELVDATTDKELKDKILFIQWRVARIARMRAEHEARMGQSEQARKDADLADRLDENNAVLTKLKREMIKARERALRVMTPHEALRMQLSRLDFSEARRLAEPILKDDPDDPEANFAMGIDYYGKKQWARSEEYLRRCLIKRPRQPAVWNNLALICLHTERYDEGLELAQKALDLIPNSAEVKDTIKQLKDAREKAEIRKR